MGGAEKKQAVTLGMIVSGFILTVAVVSQIVLAFLLYNREGDVLVRNLGWGVLWISAFFGWWPMWTMKRRGKVDHGKSYIHTTALVDLGPYSLVRHPQYLAGILMGIALAMIAQHWLVELLGIVVAVISYVGTYQEERDLVEKFGAEYEAYRIRVPRVNFVWGILKWIFSRNLNEKKD